MQIRNQDWQTTETHLVLPLNEPYWGAWKKYNYPIRCEGIGISVEAIQEAKKIDKKIKVVVTKYGEYEITAKKAYSFINKYRHTARDNKTIIVIPRIEFNRIPQLVEKPTPKNEQLSWV